jgi:hypothetical protein
MVLGVAATLNSFGEISDGIPTFIIKLYYVYVFV